MNQEKKMAMGTVASASDEATTRYLGGQIYWHRN